MGSSNLNSIQCYTLTMNFTINGLYQSFHSLKRGLRQWNVKQIYADSHLLEGKRWNAEKLCTKCVFPTEPKTNERFRIVSPHAHNWRYVRLNQSFNEISIRDNSIWWHVGWMAFSFQQIRNDENQFVIYHRHQKLSIRRLSLSLVIYQIFVKLTVVICEGKHHWCWC